MEGTDNISPAGGGEINAMEASAMAMGVDYAISLAPRLDTHIEGMTDHEV